jgi:hypothetical protein
VSLRTGSHKYGKIRMNAYAVVYRADSKRFGLLQSWTAKVVAVSQLGNDELPPQELS